MSDENKSKPTTKLDKAYDRARGVEPPATSTALVPSSELEALGLSIFDAELSGDIQRYDPARFQARLKSGHTMVERYLDLQPGDEIVGWLLGASSLLLPPLERGEGLRYHQKLHLELRSGSRVSHLGAAQLRGLFLLPMDGSCEVVIVRGEKVSIDGGKTMTNWGCSYELGKRPATHPSGKGYAQVASEAALHHQLASLKLEELMRVTNAPDGYLEPYIEQGHKRVADARAVDAARRTPASA